MTNDTAQILQSTLYSGVEEDARGAPANVVDGLFAIARGLEKVARAIEDYRTDHPLQGETFDGIESALEVIAGAIEGREHTGIQSALEAIATAIDEHK